MSAIGFSELVILFLIGLVVLGPQRLPEVARQLGTWLGQARRMTRMMKRQLEDELNFERELSIRPPHTTPRADDFSPIHPTVPEMEDTDPQTADVNADDEAEDIPEEKGS